MNRSGEVVHDFLTGLQFLTRLRFVAQEEWRPERFGRSVKYFPLIGLLSGSLLALAAFATAGWLPGTVRISLLLCAGFLVHGFLHEDGLMDTADGLFSGQDRERMLEIMKDSRVGAGGVISIILLLLLKWSLMMDMPSSILPYALLFATVYGRFAITVSVVAFPYARSVGMGKAFAEHAGPTSGWVAAMFTLLIWLGSVWMAPTVIGKAAGVAGVLGVGFAWFFGSYLTGRLGGLTGDMYGAACELTELLTLAVFLVIATFRMEWF